MLPFDRKTPKDWDRNSTFGKEWNSKDVYCFVDVSWKKSNIMTWYSGRSMVKEEWSCGWVFGFSRGQDRTLWISSVSAVAGSSKKEVICLTWLSGQSWSVLLNPRSGVQEGSLKYFSRILKSKGGRVEFTWKGLLEQNTSGLGELSSHSYLHRSGAPKQMPLSKSTQSFHRCSRSETWPFASLGMGLSRSPPKKTNYLIWACCHTCWNAKA